MSADDLNKARHWLERATHPGVSADMKHAYAHVAQVWAYIAWVGIIDDTS